MLATFSRVAARHDRSIVPLLSVWDSHHLRVSFRVLKSVSTANELEGSIGWRVHAPTKEEVVASIDSGLHHDSSLVHLPMHCMLPLKYPIDRTDPRVSGPLWVGSMGDRGAMSSMTEERALESCGPVFTVGDPLGWDERRVEAERRRVARSVRHISEESGVISSSHLVVVDDLEKTLVDLRPDVILKGKEHSDRSNIEEQIIVQYGGALKFAGGDSRLSSWALLQAEKGEEDSVLDRVTGFFDRHSLSVDSIRSVIESISGLRVLVIGALQTHLPLPIVLPTGLEGFLVPPPQPCPLL